MNQNQDFRYNKIPLLLENELRCGCQYHSDIVARYNKDTVEIRCKHKQTVRLKVVDGELREER
jgi:hypothetical protein